MKKILWLSPNFNHYKACFLNHLANAKEIELTVLSGTGREGMGDQEIDDPCDFNHIRLDVSKQIAFSNYTYNYHDNSVFILCEIYEPRVSNSLKSKLENLTMKYILR